VRRENYQVAYDIKEMVRDVGLFSCMYAEGCGFRNPIFYADPVMTVVANDISVNGSYLLINSSAQEFFPAEEKRPRRGRVIDFSDEQRPSVFTFKTKTTADAGQQVVGGAHNILELWDAGAKLKILEYRHFGKRLGILDPDRTFEKSLPYTFGTWYQIMIVLDWNTTTFDFLG
jgi:hypothetical protein